MIKKSSKKQYWWQEFDEQYKRDLKKAGDNTKLKDALTAAYKKTKEDIKQDFEKKFRQEFGEGEFQRLIAAVGQKKS